MIVTAARRRAVLLSGLALLGGLLAVQSGSPATSAGPFCAPTGLDVNTFQPPGATGDWLESDNWSDGVPDNTEAATGYVCIPAGKTALMTESGTEARLQLIDVAGGLQISQGNKLFVYGDQATRPSTFRPGSVVSLNTSTLGGPGRVDVLGTMRWTSTINGASTITSRPCRLVPDCAGPAPVGERGLLVVGDTGKLIINGRGVNLVDQYRIRVHGLVRLVNQGYIAADRGTSFELRKRTAGTKVGRLRISNDGGYYEGQTFYGQTMLSAFLNRGLLIKDGGTGSSVVAATYTLGKGGGVRVERGTLDITTDEPQLVEVAKGRTFGDGGCASYDAYACSVQVGAAGDGLNPQRSSFTASKKSAAKVRLYELGSAPAGSIGTAVRIHAKKLKATAKKPAILNLRLDDSILGGKTWKQVKVLRRPNSGGSYQVVPKCTKSGKPPAGSKACVDRRKKAGSSRNVFGVGDPAGSKLDVVMVIRTTGTSRWVAR